METTRRKRPLEVIDANSSSSNSSKGIATSETSHKKHKSKPRSVEAALLRARDVSSSMLPSIEARRKVIDQTTFARGSIERLHHDEHQGIVSFILVSSPTSAASDYAELPVVCKGEWVKVHLVSALQEHSVMILAFKEASFGKSAPTSTSTSNTLFENYILFERGVEFWTATVLPLVSTPVSGQLPLPLSWQHYRLFSAAQQPEPPSERQVTLRGPPNITQAPVDPPVPATGIDTSETTRGRSVPLVQAHAEESRSTATGTQDSDLVQTRRDLLAKFERALSSSQRAISARRARRPSPPTGITQVEPGTSEGGIPERDTGTAEPEDPKAFRSSRGVEYQSVSDLREDGPSHRDVNVLGVAIESASPAVPIFDENSGKKFLTLRLVDPSVGGKDADGWRGGRWLGVTYMDPNQEHFPIVRRGDVILIRGAKTVTYSEGGHSVYTRLCIYPDQICDWVILPIETLGQRSGSALLEPVHSDSFQVAATADVPDDEERQQMHKMGLWSREQLIASAGFQAKDWSAAAGITYRGEHPLRQFSELRIADGSQDSDPFDIVCKIVGLPNLSGDKVHVLFSDYTANPLSDLYSPLLTNESLTPHMVLKVLMWQNEAFDELVEATLDRLRQKDGIFLLKGLKVRMYNGAMNANVRLNKSDFTFECLGEDNPLYQIFQERRQEYLQAHAPPVQAVQPKAEARRGAASDALNQNTSNAERTMISDDAPAETIRDIEGINPAQRDIAKDLLQPELRKIKRLGDLIPPAHASDPKAFFDCVCEITEDGNMNDRFSLTTITVTDFTCNDRFWLNMNNPAYPQTRIIMQVAVFGAHQREKVLSLRKGERVHLQNVRAKLDRQGNLEGHVGERNDFKVAKLAPESEGYKLLETSRLSAISGTELEEHEAEGSVHHPGPSKTYAGVACKFAGLPVDNGIFQPLAIDSEKIFRLRGRVIDYSPKHISDFLVYKCEACDRFLEKHERLCGDCDDRGPDSYILQKWCFSLRIEVEPKDCNIDRDAVEPSRAFWVSVVEDNTFQTEFMNGLKPSEDSLVEATRLLTPLLDTPSACNGTNPVFDFCLKKSAGQRILLMCDTALRRDGKNLPWV